MEQRERLGDGIEALVQTQVLYVLRDPAILINPSTTHSSNLMVVWFLYGNFAFGADRWLQHFSVDHIHVHDRMKMAPWLMRVSCKAGFWGFYPPRSACSATPYVDQNHQRHNKAETGPRTAIDASNKLFNQDNGRREWPHLDSE